MMTNSLHFNQEIANLANNAKAWPFVEAKKFVEEYLNENKN